MDFDHPCVKRSSYRVVLIFSLGIVVAAQPANAQTILPDSNGSTIHLHMAYPGQADFLLPAGSQITNTSTTVQGDNSQNWSVTNRGVIQAGNTTPSSGIKLGGINLNTSRVDNYGAISSTDTQPNGPSAVQFTKGGIVYNYAGATISGGSDGVHTDGGSIAVYNYGTITTQTQSGIYSGQGALITNYEGGAVSGRYGINSNGPKDMVIVNYGTITGTTNAIALTGGGQDSVINAASGVIRGQSNAVAIQMQGRDANNRLLNYGQIISDANVAIQGTVNNHTYINAGLIQAGGSAEAIQIKGNGNTFYNLNTIVSASNAIHFTGDNNLLVLGQQTPDVLTPGLHIVGPGSSITGAVIATGSNNRIQLTDNGTLNSIFTNFAGLIMAGVDWQLLGNLTLNGTAADSVTIRSGQLKLLGNLSTAGGAVIDNGGILSIDRLAVLDSPGGVINNGVLNGYGLINAPVVNNGTLNAGSASSGLIDPASGALTIAGALLNNGNIDLRGSQIGNTLRVLGNYSGQGGLRLNTALGGDDSPTDQLFIDGQASGTTAIFISNLGGRGAQTNQGIRVINLGSQGSNTDGAFRLGGPVVAGLYDYNLYRNPADQQWYLYSTLEPPPPPGPGPSPAPRPNYRPEIGSYLANIQASTTLFQHSLFDRSSSQGQSAPSSVGWVRVVGNNEKSQALNGLMQFEADTALIQLGSDIYHTRLALADDDLRIGLMAGYGHVDTTARVSGNSRYSDGDVDGFAAGAYATWFAQTDRKHGAYIDLWALYGWQRNQVSGQHLPEQNYHSNTLNASLEAGYIWTPLAGSPWYIVPQLQAIWSNYNGSTHHEPNTGLSVEPGNISGWTTRAGIRVYGDVALSGQHTLQPFIELNWYNNSGQFSALFNQTDFSFSNTRQFGEVKLGIAGNITPALQIWGQAMTQQGENHYRAYGGELGLKYRF